MKTCPHCGGQLYRHETKPCKVVATAQRYRCSRCRHTVTVRGGEVSTLRGRPAKDAQMVAT